MRLPRRRFLGLGVAGLAAALGRRGSPHVAAQPIEERVVLPNGLLVIVEERRSADTVALQLSARAGSRYDGSVPGIAVITSRMMFQGTSRRPSETALQRAAAGAGGTLTRGTSVDSSSLASVMPSREVALAFDLLSDVVLDPLFDAAALDRQRSIALQEIAQRRANPSSLVDELFNASIFAGHPLGTPVLGTEESLRAIGEEIVSANHQTYWSAANLVLTIVGRIRAADALRHASDAFSSLPTGSRNADLEVPLPLLDPRQTVSGEAGQQQAIFRIGFRAPALPDPDRYAMTVLNALMADSDGRLFRELRVERGLAYSAGSAYRAFRDGATWFTQAAVDPSNLPQAIEVATGEIERLRQEMAESDELAGTVSQAAGAQVLADETNAARAARLTSQEILGTDPTDVLLRNLALVTPADVQRVALRHLGVQNALHVVVGPRRS